MIQAIHPGTGTLGVPHSMGSDTLCRAPFLCFCFGPGMRPRPHRPSTWSSILLSTSGSRMLSPCSPDSVSAARPRGQPDSPLPWCPCWRPSWPLSLPQLGDPGSPQSSLLDTAGCQAGLGKGHTYLPTDFRVKPPVAGQVGWLTSILCCVYHVPVRV